eukprot:gene1159-1266_t
MNDFSSSFFVTPSPRIRLSINDLQEPSRALSFDESVSESQVKRQRAPLTPLLSPTVKLDSRTPSLAASQSADVSEVNRMDYKKELAKLLLRSRGTPYEKTLKKFVEAKILEIDYDRNQRQAEEQVLTSGSPDGKISLSGLSKSKYDPTPQPKEYTPFVKTTETYWKERFEEMSRPLDRHKYTGREELYPRVTTNHLGRQRPAPKIASTKSTWRSSSPQWGEVPPGPRVPEEEFQQWLQQNEEWAQRSKIKISQAKVDAERTVKAQAKPRIYAKSVKLAELAQRKEAAQLSQSLLALSNQPPTGRQSRRPRSAYSSPIASLSPTRSVGSMNDVSSVWSVDNSHLDVYGRLSLRGRVHAEKRRNWSPPKVEASFSPSITRKSIELARKHRESQSASPCRPIQGRTAAANQSATTRPLSRDNLSVVSDPLETNSAGRREKSPLVQARVIQQAYDKDRVPTSVRRALERSRSASQAREEQTQAEKSKREYIQASTKTKPFQPTLVSEESQRIMARKNSSFEERNLRSIENILLRQVIASRSSTPGPGYYDYKVRVTSPPPGVRHHNSVRHASSPGYQGYSFAKEKRDSSLGRTGIDSDVPPASPLFIDFHSKTPRGRVMASPRSSPQVSKSTAKAKSHEEGTTRMTQEEIQL